jgi:hypothetical protein
MNLLRPALAWLALSTAWNGSAAAQLPYSRVLLAGSTQVDWSGTSVSLTTYNVPWVNASGQVSMRGGGAGMGAGHIFGDPASLKLAAASGSTPTGLPGDVDLDLNFVFIPALGNGGHLAFKAALQGPSINSTNDRGVFITPPTASLAVTIARTGDAAVGAGAGVNYAAFDLPSVNASGRVLFTGSMTGAGIVAGQNDTGIWSGGPSGGASAVILSGGAAPQLGGLSLASTRFVVQGDAVMAFSGTLSGAGVNSSNNEIVYHGGPGDLQVAAREGDGAPGVSGATFMNLANTVESIRMTRSGTVYFTAGMQGGGVTSTTNQGLWRGTPANVQLVQREGDQAPGMPAGVVYRLNPTFVVNNSGQFAFVTPVSDTGGVTPAGFAHFYHSTGVTSLVAANGQLAPGADGATFNLASSALSPVISESGAMAIQAALAGPGVNSSNDQGIWMYVAGQLHLVAREGAFVDFDPGVGVDMHQISLLQLGAHSFADDGRLIWTAFTTDGFQASFFSISPVPEPGALGLVSLAVIVGLLGWKRRQRAA